MTIILQTNPFRGINPLLNSLLQSDLYDEAGEFSPSMWPAFHSTHITYISDSLNKLLIPLGYIAMAEQGLQLQLGSPIDYPDSTIYDQTPNAERELSIASQSFSARVPIADVLDMAKAIRGVTIYRQPKDHMILGKPITRIELLSPGNKRGGSYYATYIFKRSEVLQSGTSLIEIDYLHETQAPYPSPFVPPYPVAPNSHPYYVAVTNIRLPEPAAIIQAFNVDEPIPMLDVPLAGQQTASFDLDAVYQYSYQAGPWWTLIDHDKLPDRLTSYNQSDQDRIRQRLDQVRANHSTSQG